MTNNHLALKYEAVTVSQKSPSLLLAFPRLALNQVSHHIYACVLIRYWCNAVAQMRVSFTE
jgi:hypothetical protein